MHGLDEAHYLRWNQAAVNGPKGAQAWADRGVFEHDTAIYKYSAPAGPAGENLAMYSPGYGVDAVDPPRQDEQRDQLVLIRGVWPAFAMLNMGD